MHMKYIGTRYFFFFFNDTATTEIYTLSLHDALPICAGQTSVVNFLIDVYTIDKPVVVEAYADSIRSEEHTSELQSQSNIVCRLLLEKKNDTLRGYANRPRESQRLPPRCGPRTCSGCS